MINTYKADSLVTFSSGADVFFGNGNAQYTVSEDAHVVGGNVLNGGLQDFGRFPSSWKTN